MRFLLLLAVLTGTVTGCALRTSHSTEWSRLEAEQEIFEAVLDTVLATWRSERLLVRRLTSRGFIQEQLPDRFLASLEEFPGLSAEAAADFLSANEEPRLIGEMKHPRFRVELVDDSVLTALQSTGSSDLRDSWRRVRDHFEGATTIVRYSRPGFNAERDHAFLVVNYGCGPLCGAGYNILMRRGTRGWYVARLVNTFVA